MTKTLAVPTDAVMPWEEAHRALAHQLAVESIVLLENDGALPMAPCRVALFGAGGEKTCKGGTGSGEVNERHSVSIAEGLAAAGFTVTTDRWLAAYRRRYEDTWNAYVAGFRKSLYHLRISQLANIMQDPFCAPVGQAIEEADLPTDTDACIYVVTRQAGEGSDRKLDRHEYSLTPEETEQITLCAARFSRFILVLNVGGPFDMDFLEQIPGINAVLFFAQQGGMGGAALADLLTGTHTPSGRLSDTWARHYDDLPFSREYSYLNGQLQEEYYREDIYVGYRYFDTFGVAPRYPFGFGRSYTTFSHAMTDILRDREKIALTATVTNTGGHPGKQVLQLYAACPQSEELPKERQRLVAFAKTEVLQPGQSQSLTLRFSARDLASYRPSDDATVLEAGGYVLHLGSHSRDTQAVAVVTLPREHIFSRHRKLCAPVTSMDILTHSGTATPLPQLPEVTLSHLPTGEFTYADPVPMDMELTEKEQIRLCVGGGMFRKRRFDAPGAAGVTTGKLPQLPQAVLADGPAGLRLQQQSVLLKNGGIKPVEPAMEILRCLPDFVKAFLCADPQKGQVLYQFTTAFPVELAQAQTWNLPLLEQMGRAVGREMEAYGVSYWLAPALNIHRNPLCGRNYEYYSEDPLLTGKSASAVTRGVQSVPGRFVTLKHFACNNQEDNRNGTNANVSVRALREIYLRGFQLAVEESAPEAVMSSYNRLNGVYTANSHDLLTHILRCEWGFTGLVMTDWLATGTNHADDGLCIAAGNDLIMPGSFLNERALRKALRKGHITQEQLQRCAANVLHSLQRTQP